MRHTWNMALSISYEWLSGPTTYFQPNRFFGCSLSAPSPPPRLWLVRLSNSRSCPNKVRLSTSGRLRTPAGRWWPTAAREAMGKRFSGGLLLIDSSSSSPSSLVVTSQHLHVSWYQGRFLESHEALERWRLVLSNWLTFLSWTLDEHDPCRYSFIFLFYFVVLSLQLQRANDWQLMRPGRGRLRLYIPVVKSRIGPIS